MIKSYLGIDPGKTGALGILSRRAGDGWKLATYDLPFCEETGITDPSALHDLLRPHRNSICTIEHVHSMPGQGVASTFKFGSGYGVCLAAAAIAQLDIKLVRPAKWKGDLKCPADKKKAIARANTLFPFIGEILWPRVKDNGRAEAAMIALHGALKDGADIRGVNIDDICI